MKKAIVFGAGGHARVIASMLVNEVSEITFVEHEPTAEGVVEESAILGNIDAYRDHQFYIGIGSNTVRSKIYKRLSDLNIVVANCIAKNAFIAHDAHLGNGVVVCPGSVVGSKAVIGNNTIINTLSSVDHDCVLGDHSQVTAGVTFGGTVTTGVNCFFGVKSAVIPGINIGDNSVVMAGSVVYKDVPERVMVGGNPARLMKQL
ncbi:MAG: acetyltransferase [Flavobacteriales bacterium]|nr:acetyltransferase [Flavobacteriales bacterium]